MPNTPLAKVPYPSGSDAPAAASDMMSLVMSMDSRLVLPAVDEADRDAKYADAPTSTLVVSGESKKMWVKTGTGAADWLIVWSDTGWIDDGFIAKDGWSINNISGRNRNGILNIRGEMLREGDDVTANTAGNFADVDMVSVPPQLRPVSNALSVIGIARGEFTSGTCQLYGSGNVRLLDAHANSSIRNDSYMRFSFSFLEG